MCTQWKYHHNQYNEYVCHLQKFPRGYFYLSPCMPSLLPGKHCFALVTIDNCWRRKWKPTLVFLTGESHGQRITKSWTWLSAEYTCTIDKYVFSTISYKWNNILCILFCLTSFALRFYLDVQFSSVAQSFLTLCDPMDCSKSGLPVHHQIS